MKGPFGHGDLPPFTLSRFTEGELLMATPTAYDIRQDQIARAVTAAENYVSDTMDAFQNAGIMLSMAMQTASTSYDLIMKAEATKPLSIEIFTGVILTILPSLKIFSNVAGKIGGATFSASGDPISKAAKAAKLLDDHYLSLIGNVRDPIKSQNEKESGYSEIQSQLNSRNTTAMQAFGRFLDLLQNVSALSRSSRKFIQKDAEGLSRSNVTPDILSIIQNDYKANGLDGNPTVGKDKLGILSDMLLYDMLRDYVKSNVTIKIADGFGANPSIPKPPPAVRGIPQTRNVNQDFLDWKAVQSLRISDLPTERHESLVNGLDQAKRDAIYKQFGGTGYVNSLEPGDTSRAKVNSYKDFIKWGAKTVGLSGRVYNFK